MDGDMQPDECARHAARRGANAAAAGDGGAGAAATVADPGAVPLGAAFDDSVNVSLPDVGSEYDDLDREDDPTGVVEALQTPALTRRVAEPPQTPTTTRLPSSTTDED